MRTWLRQPMFVSAAAMLVMACSSDADVTSASSAASSGPGASSSTSASGGGGSGGSGGSGGMMPAYDCDARPPRAPASPEGLTLQSEWGDPDKIEVRTRGIWAIWWYPEFMHEQDTSFMFDQLDDVRCRSLVELKMKDPPNPERGVFYNVYVHHGDQDGFPNAWANGQGTDSTSNPYLTLPNGAHLDVGNLNHEGFHVFQYTADSPGFGYAGDSQWYIETTAQWYAAYREPTVVDTFVEAGAIDGNPHLALWHSFSNEAPGDPTDWMFQVRQYGMHTLLFYLSEVANVNREIFTSGFYGGVTKSPQQYMFDGVGADTFRGYFADWAAHNTADFDYLTREQVARARTEVMLVGDPNNAAPYVAELGSEGATDWASPPDKLRPRGWAYNVVKVTAPTPGNYAAEVKGDPKGSEGADAHFEARLVVKGTGGYRFADLTMTDALTGQGSLMVEAGDTELYLVVASVPEFFGGNQTYGYAYKVSKP